jgi:hypothetical protein
MGKARKTPDQIVEKQIRAAQAATQDYQAGISSVTQPPNAIAATKVQKYLQSVTEAVNNGTFVAANQAVTLEDWKRPALEKGVQRYAPGVAAARPKLMKFQREYGPIRDSITDQIRAMPNDTVEERIARSVAIQRALHQSPYKRKRV